MEHSVRAYIKRLPTEKLEMLLQECQKQEQMDNYRHVMPYVMEVLAKRNVREDSHAWISECGKE